MKPKPVPAILLTLTLSALPLFGQGMPPEARDNIHKLFNGHSSIKRTVELTDSGYIALTESTDPQIAAVLQAHVRQMEQRLESGLMVRRWDPAFAEYVAHYRDLTHQIEPTSTGLKIVVFGKTPTAILVAQNHARVISEFVADGWAAHDRRHPAVAQIAATPDATESTPSNSGPGCCQAGNTPSSAAPACCGRRAATSPLDASPGGCCQDRSSSQADLPGPKDPQ